MGLCFLLQLNNLLCSNPCIDWLRKYLLQSLKYSNPELREIQAYGNEFDAGFVLLDAPI